MLDHEDYQAIFPTVLFYARRAILREAIFVSDRLDTLGVDLKLRIACELARKAIRNFRPKAPSGAEACR